MLYNLDRAVTSEDHAALRTCKHLLNIAVTLAQDVNCLSVSYRPVPQLSLGLFLLFKTVASAWTQPSLGHSLPASQFKSTHTTVVG